MVELIVAVVSFHVVNPMIAVVPPITKEIRSL